LLERAPLLESAQSKPRVQAWRQPRWAWFAAAVATASAAGVVFLLQAPVTTQRAREAHVQLPAADSPAAVNSTAVERSEAPVEGMSSSSANSSPSPGAKPRDTTSLLRDLARITPPSYRPLVLRGPVDDATAAFSNAMKAYGAGDFAAAVRGLQTASQLDPTRPDIAFFLGVSGLLSDDLVAGRAALQRTIDLGDSPFVGPAHFYLAKADLGTGNVESARKELELARASGGDMDGETGRLLGQLEEFR
jgi:hypothetical protein